MNTEVIRRPALLPAGYGDAWPEEGLPPPLWEVHELRPHHNEATFNLQALALGLAPDAEPEEHLLESLYGLRAGHWHAAFGTLVPPQTFRLSGGLMGPMLHYPDFRSVYAQVSPAGKVLGYVSALPGGGEPVEVLPFSVTLEGLMRIIAWDSEPVPVPAGRWCPSGANGPALR